MIKKLLITLLVAISCYFTLNAEGFKNLNENYYFKTAFTYAVEDWSPAMSDQFYVALSFDNGTTWQQITEITSWENPRPATKTFSYLPETIVSNALISIFVNPNDEWATEPVDVHTINFVQSFGQFTSIPTEIYNGGTYTLKTQFQQNQLPDQLTLQFTQDGINWNNIEQITMANEVVYNFINTYLNPGFVQYRYVYNETNIVVAKSENIPVIDRNTYFRFKTYSGTKNLNDVVQIDWEKSTNFENVDIQVYLNDSLVSKSTYQTDGLFLNFTTFGNWKVIGTVQSTGFEIKETLFFTVDDPCSELKLENDTLTKENVRLTDANTKWINENVRKDSIITSLSGLIAELQTTVTLLTEDNMKLRQYIIDSTIIQLVYKADDVLSVKAETRIENANLITYDNNIVKFLEPFTGETTIWLFNYTGQLIVSNCFKTETVELNIESYTSGVYFIWVLNNNEYKLYKFVKA